MKYVALVSDYDGTLARSGLVPDETLHELQRFRQSGRKLILVTGRELKNLESVFSRCDLFDRIVAENGAVLYTPATREKQILASPPKSSFLEVLNERGVQPIGVGDAIVSTWHPHETTVLEVIRDLGLELQVIFNKGAVMVLPSGVNKRTGLKAALNGLGISEHNVVGVGDAENDHAFLQFCELSVAVANALPAVKEAADLTTEADHGAGVVELIKKILKDEFDNKFPKRRWIAVGHLGERDLCVPPYGSSLLVSGASGSGKSTFVAGFLEILIERQYQVCVIDPEGDYEGFPDATTVGDEKHAPSIDEVLQILQNPLSQIIVNLIGVAVADRPKFFGTLLPRLQEMRLGIGRPHWIIVDEAHHMLPAQWEPASAAFASEINNMVLITVHPDHIAPAALKNVEAVIAVGAAPEKVIETFAKVIGVASPATGSAEPAPGQMAAWFPRTGDLHCLDIHFSHTERKRHKRNYAYGELGEDRSFYFRGPQQKLNLRAQNLATFLQLAEGLDDETWLYHLTRGDYSKWFREGIKDEALADEVAQYERAEPIGNGRPLGPRESREKVKAAIEQRYTAPA